MELVKHSDADRTIIQVVASRIDAAGSIRFKDLMRDEVLNASGTVLVDLSAVNFVDSSGLGAIVAVRKMIGADRDMELAGLTPNVEKVFRLTRMDKVFKIHETPSVTVPTEGL